MIFEEFSLGDSNQFYNLNSALLFRIFSIPDYQLKFRSIWI